MSAESFARAALAWSLLPPNAVCDVWRYESADGVKRELCTLVLSLAGRLLPGGNCHVRQRKVTP